MIQHQPRVYDDALPQDVFRRLQDAIGSMPSPAHSHWFDARRRPENLVELVIASLQHTVRPGSECAGAEWWFRREPARLSKRLHFDKDEALAGRGEYVHPKLASVLYLTNTGGHTLITDQRCSSDGRTLSPATAQRHVVVTPRENRYLVFDGSLLHGVLPAKSGDVSERTTLLINWWDRRLSDADDRSISSETLGLSLETIPLVAGRRALSPSAARECVVKSGREAQAS